MKILEDKTVQGSPIKVPLEYRCPHCDSLLLIEEGGFTKPLPIFKSQPKKEYYFVIKGKEILATSYKDAIKKYNHKYK